MKTATHRYLSVLIAFSAAWLPDSNVVIVTKIHQNSNAHILNVNLSIYEATNILKELERLPKKVEKITMSGSKQPVNSHFGRTAEYSSALRSEFDFQHAKALPGGHGS